MSRYISQCYSFALEMNLPSGRADLVMFGLPGTAYHNDCRVVELKYLIQTYVVYIAAGKAYKVWETTLTE